VSTQLSPAVMAWTCPWTHGTAVKSKVSSVAEGGVPGRCARCERPAGRVLPVRASTRALSRWAARHPFFIGCSASRPEALDCAGRRNSSVARVRRRVDIADVNAHCGCHRPRIGGQKLIVGPNRIKPLHSTPGSCQPRVREAPARLRCGNRFDEVLFDLDGQFGLAATSWASARRVGPSCAGHPLLVQFQQWTAKRSGRHARKTARVRI